MTAATPTCHTGTGTGDHGPGCLRLAATTMAPPAQTAFKVEASTAQLQGLMADLEEKADVMTALALFPVKRIDKKVAFILGLATLFKSLYSLSELFAVRGGNFSDLLDLTVQLGLVFVFFSHYGLVKALSNPAQDLSFPAPPQDFEG